MLPLLAYLLATNLLVNQISNIGFCFEDALKIFFSDKYISILLE
jgi:hypothetical protein